MVLTCPLPLAGRGGLRPPQRRVAHPRGERKGERRAYSSRSQNGSFFYQKIGTGSIQKFEALEKDRDFWKGLQRLLWLRPLYRLVAANRTCLQTNGPLHYKHYPPEPHVKRGSLPEMARVLSHRLCCHGAQVEGSAAAAAAAALSVSFEQASTAVAAETGTVSFRKDMIFPSKSSELFEKDTNFWKGISRFGCNHCILQGRQNKSGVSTFPDFVSPPTLVEGPHGCVTHRTCRWANEIELIAACQLTIERAAFCYLDVTVCNDRGAVGKGRQPGPVGQGALSCSPATR